MRQFFGTLVLIVCLAATANVHAQYRDTPECLNEQLTMAQFQGALLQDAVAGETGEGPGTLEMLGPFADARYQGNEWQKRSWGQIFRTSSSRDPGYVQRYTVKIHFMWNTNTRMAHQVKFKTTASQGCEGSRTIALVLDGAGTGGLDPTNTLVYGYSTVNDGTTYIRYLFPNVEVVALTTFEQSAGYTIGSCWRDPELCRNTVPTGGTSPSPKD